jgi:3-isopropylmalate/(R)-2-methylmalate dehydratase small subunit
MDFIFEGSAAWVFPDHFDIDLIIGVQNVRENDIEKLVPVCMKAYDPNFVNRVKPGDILVGGRNFAYGHAHPQVMAVLRKIGINIVLAESFAPGFFRGETGNGMVLMKVPEITRFVDRFDKLRVEFDKGIVCNKTKGINIIGIPPNPISLELVKNKGYLGFLKKELERN